MPMMDLTYPAGAISEEARSELAEQLTTVLLRAERAPDTAFFRNITWLYVHELPQGTVIAAGQPVSEPTFRLQVTIPQGALSERRKGELVEAATSTILAAAGLSEADALRVWVLVYEVPDGNWGAGGSVIRFQQLLEFAAREREQPGAALVS